MQLANIQLYIDSGWHTIPYDSITYNEEGRKVAYPPTKWKEYRYQKNLKPSKAGALIAGERSGVIVVDCDTIEAAQQILAIAEFEGIASPSDLAVKGVEELIGLVVRTTRGYHFYFKWEEGIEDAKGPKIDIQASENKLVYLATTQEASEGKEILACNKVYENGKHVIKLHQMTPKLKEYLVSLVDSKEETAARKQVRFNGGVPLAKIPQGTVQYYKRITPKSFRSMPHYRKIIDEKGYLHPDDIRDGEGNDYIIAVAGIFATDTTIDYDDFFKHLEFINDQWTNPLSQEALQRKIVPYATGRYEGCPFNYDEDWEKASYSFTDVDGRGITLSYELMSGKFIIGEHDSGRVMLKGAQEIVNYYMNRMMIKMSPPQIAGMVPGVYLVYEPTKPFGLYSDESGEGRFNGFKKNKYVDILNEHEAQYSEDEIENAKDNKIVPFIHHLFKEHAEYFLSFLKRKLTTFSYSPVIFCLFDQRGGAGKGALESWLGEFTGSNRVAAIPEKSFREKFTGPYEGKLFMFHNEYSEERAVRAENTNFFKERSGSSKLSIQKKGLEAYDVPNMVTMFVTSNKVSIELADEDRRFCVSNCTDKFDTVFGGLKYYNAMVSDEEMTKFAIYLKYKVQSLTDEAYMTPPTSAIKEAFVESTLTRPNQFVRAMTKHDWFTVREIGGDGAIIPTHHIVDLTAAADFMNVSVKSITKEIKLAGLMMDVKSDTNKKYRLDKYIRYVKFNEGDMIELLVQDLAPQESSKGTKI